MLVVTFVVVTIHYQGSLLYWFSLQTAGSPLVSRFVLAVEIASRHARNVQLYLNMPLKVSASMAAEVPYCCEQLKGPGFGTYPSGCTFVDC